MTSKITDRCINKEQIKTLGEIINYKNKQALSVLVNDIQTVSSYSNGTTHLYRQADWGCTKLYLFIDTPKNEIIVQKWFDYQKNKYIDHQYYKINSDGNIIQSELS